MIRITPGEVSKEGLSVLKKQNASKKLRKSESSGDFSQ